jgi:hypothetical protein
LSAIDPRQPVEEQGVIVPRREPLQLAARTMQQHRPQPPDLGSNVRRNAPVCRHDGEITDCQNTPSEGSSPD